MVQGDQAAGDARIQEIFSPALPKLDYRKVSAITVKYPPGAASPKHRHDVAVFAYVLEGTVQSRLQGQGLKVFEQGEMWYEPPGTVHLVSRNASDTEPAKLLVFFVGEHGASATTPLGPTEDKGSAR